MTNLDSILKSRDITLPTKVHLVKAMVFPVVVYRSESWTIKKAEHRRIDAFELWCWRRLLRAPWTPRGSNPSILKEINPKYPLEGLMLKLQSFDSGEMSQGLAPLSGDHTPLPPQAGEERGDSSGGKAARAGLGLGEGVHCLLILPGVAPSKKNSQAVTFI